MTFPFQMTLLSLAILLVTVFVAGADNRYFERVADAIFLAEGGAKTRFPYGVRIWDAETGTWRPSANPRAECLAIIRRQHARWIAKDRQGDFINFIARAYCPASDDQTGHDNFVRNVNHFLTRLEQ
jgi:hypothetical protein